MYSRESLGYPTVKRHELGLQLSNPLFGLLQPRHVNSLPTVPELYAQLLAGSNLPKTNISLLTKFLKKNNYWGGMTFTAASRLGTAKCALMLTIKICPLNNNFSFSQTNLKLTQHLLMVINKLFLRLLTERIKNILALFCRYCFIKNVMFVG